MKIYSWKHWLIKYYLLALTLKYRLIETKEPYVNWNLYPNLKNWKLKK